jgi:eukaryotic-like serine/threonine-protein kinase
MARSASFTTGAITAIVTAATYLFMYFVVQPRLPVVEAEVPPIGGLSAEQARGLLEPRGLLLILDGEKVDERVPAGTLTAQQPLGGSRLRRGGEVHAFVATVPSSPTVPRLAGLAIDAAREALVKARLRAGNITETPSDSVPKGQVITTSPVMGVEVKADSAVDLSVSSGPAAGTVPSVIGKRLSKAKELLQQAGFVFGSSRYGSNDDFDQGVVISQTPAANSPAPKGSKVDLVVND